jgi:hypothetical protein
MSGRAPKSKRSIRISMVIGGVPSSPGFGITNLNRRTLGRAGEL